MKYMLTIVLMAMWYAPVVFGAEILKKPKPNIFEIAYDVKRPIDEIKRAELKADYEAGLKRYENQLLFTEGGSTGAKLNNLFEQKEQELKKAKQGVAKGEKLLISHDVVDPESGEIIQQGQKTTIAKRMEKLQEQLYEIDQLRNALQFIPEVEKKKPEELIYPPDVGITEVNPEKGSEGEEPVFKIPASSQLEMRRPSQAMPSPSEERRQEIQLLVQSIKKEMDKQLALQETGKEQKNQRIVSENSALYREMVFKAESRLLGTFDDLLPLLNVDANESDQSAFAKLYNQEEKLYTLLNKQKAISREEYETWKELNLRLSSLLSTLDNRLRNNNKENSPEFRKVTQLKEKVAARALAGMQKTLFKGNIGLENKIQEAEETKKK
ncbi:MAG: hypothetical protein WCE21_05615 [Candidatus Babeliales bacterium]